MGILPVIILGTFFYLGYKMSVYREIEVNNYASLTQALNKMDYNIEKMNSIAYHFSGYKIDETLIMNNDSQVPNVNETNIVQQLKIYNETVGSVPINTILYIRGDKNIYSKEGKTLYSEFEASVRDYGDLTMSNFFKMINSLKYNTSVKMFQSEETASFDKTMTYYLYPIPYMESLPMATLCFGYRYEDIYGLIEDYLGEMTSNIYIYNEYHHNIFTSELGNLDTEIRERLDTLAMEWKGTGVFEQKIGKKSYIIMRNVSQNSGFSMVAINEKGNFYSRVDYFQKTLIFVVVLLIAVGVILAMVLSKKYYNPIQQLLLQVTGSKSKITDSEKYNEFEIIQNCWSDINNKNLELNILVDRQRPIIVESSLVNLINGKLTSPEELDFTLKSAHINLSHPYFFVILIPLPLLKNAEMEYSKSILSVIQELVHPHWHHYGIDLIQENNIAVIVNCESREMYGEDSRVYIAQSIKSSIEKKYKESLNFLIGRNYDNILDINTSYIESTVISSDLSLSKEPQIILFEQINQEDQNTQYPVLEQALYIQCLKHANKEAALKALEEMVAVISRLESFLIMQCLCYDIINMIIKTVNQLNGIDIKLIDLKKMCTFTNVEEFHKKCINVTELICTHYELFKETQNSKLRSGVINYVNANYKELSMCLDDVAMQFNLTANYVSKFFKQETGCSFIQYITMLRMDQAKELLINTNMQIKDIVAEIGYIDVANFVRKFKSYEGITPSQYRDTMRYQ
jgi:AraC-like DNA-binding protein